MRFLIFSLMLLVGCTDKKLERDAEPIRACRHECRLHLNTNIRITVGNVYTCTCDNK